MRNKLFSCYQVKSIQHTCLFYLLRLPDSLINFKPHIIYNKSNTIKDEQTILTLCQIFIAPWKGILQQSIIENIHVSLNRRKTSNQRIRNTFQALNTYGLKEKSQDHYYSWRTQQTTFLSEPMAGTAKIQFGGNSMDQQQRRRTRWHFPARSKGND